MKQVSMGIAGLMLVRLAGARLDGSKVSIASDDS